MTPLHTIATTVAASRGAGHVGSSGSAGIAHAVWTVVFILALLTIVVCVPIQRRAMNKIAFGRSVFISLTAIIFGFIIALLPWIEATIVAVALFILGYGMMILMAIKSIQHLQHVKSSRRT
jgi:Mg2+/Co2+ transporter CorB